MHRSYRGVWFNLEMFVGTFCSLGQFHLNSSRDTIFGGFKTTIWNWMKISVIYLVHDIWAKIGDARIWESNKQKLLEVHIDRTLSFDEHVSNWCKKAGTILSVFASLSSCMTVTERRVLMKSFIEAQFCYCALVWMFLGRVLN